MTVKLPALAEQSDPLGRAPGEALWPEVFSKESHEKNKATRTNYYWRAMYQQDPQAEGGTEWPDSWFGPDIWFNEWPTSWQVRTMALDPSKGTESRFGDYSASGLTTGQPKALKNKEIPGFLSAAQIAPHHTAHYGGALKAVLAADSKIEEAIKSGTKLDPAAFAHLKRTVNSRGNSVVLHELYFDGLTPKAPDPSTEVRAAIDKRFGSIDKWWDDFAASAKEAAGWAMLVKHPVNGKLYNVVSDEHAMGVLWMASPLIVIDVYEHAFYVDYLNRKPEYVDKFVKHIDWSEANGRFRSTGA